MSAYLVVDLDIHDPEAIADYRSKALPLVAKSKRPPHCSR